MAGVTLIRPLCIVRKPPARFLPYVGATLLLCLSSVWANYYQVSNYAELSSAIKSAEPGLQKVLNVTRDLRATHTIVISQNKSIKIVGSSTLGRRPRLLEENSGHRFLDMLPGTSTLWLEYLDVTGWEYYGNIFRLRRNVSVVIQNCRFADSRPGFVGVMWIEGPGASVSVHGCEFLQLSSGTYGAAMQIGYRELKEEDHPNTIDITNSVFAHNDAGSGGAISVQDFVHLTLRNCTMYGNRADNFGGAVHIVPTDVEFAALSTIAMRSSYFNNNSAGSSGGACWIGSGVQIEISNSILTNNVAGSGGALCTSSHSDALIAASHFDRNSASAGAGGALLARGTVIHMIDTNCTENYAATDGGVVRGEDQSILYPRGTTRFVGNTASASGGAIYLDASTLKSNEGALLFTFNEGRLGGALSAVNEAFVSISAGCQSITFETYWASASSATYAKRSAVVRRIRNASEAIRPEDLADERGEWMVFNPTERTNTAVSYCLSPGEYEIIGSEGGMCFESWGGGYIRIVDVFGDEIVPSFTVGISDLCSAKTTIRVTGDAALTQYRGPIRFDHNYATGLFPGVCGRGCGGAIYIHKSATAELHKVAFTFNSASDGGALFVGLLGDLSLSRTTMDNNSASGNGGAMAVGTVASISASQMEAKHNVARDSGGVLYLDGVQAATLQRVDATGNEAGNSGGAVAAVRSTYSTLTLTNATIRDNKAAASGGGLSIDETLVSAVGVQFFRNSAEHGHGGAVSTSGTGTLLEFSDIPCVDVDVVLDWSAVSSGCTDTLGGYGCLAFIWAYSETCAGLETNWGMTCDGCPCNNR